MQSIDGNLTGLASNASKTALIPKLLSMLVNMPTTSHETKTGFGKVAPRFSAENVWYP